MATVDTITGTSGNDTLPGTTGNDTIDALDGDDFLEGGLGGDTLLGGNGIDTADYVNAAEAVLVDLGTPANNTGEAAGDYYVSIERVRGSAFNDTIVGTSANDVLRGGLGGDSLVGGSGFDIVSYFDSTVGVRVSLENSALNTGEAENDTFSSIEGIAGSIYDDTLIGNSGTNFLLGNLGGDSLVGGSGSDYTDHGQAATAVVVDLSNPDNNTNEADGDSYSSIEGIRGSRYNDTLTGDAANNFLRGGLGTDALNGGAGFDFADYGDATTAVRADLATASNLGEAEGDTYNSIEGIFGSAHNDTLVGDAGGNFLRGNLGADSLVGGAGFDFADYFAATTAVLVNLGTASNSGEATGDTFNSIEGIRGGSFDDTLIGNAGDNFLRGGLGGDSLVGGAGSGDYADYIFATEGIVVHLGTPGSNTGEAAGDTYNGIERVRGSAFNDTLTGDAGNNALRGGLGADVLNGGNGIDFASYSDASAGIRVNLATPGNNTGEAVGDSYTSIEGLRGGNFNDTLIGNSGDNFLNGGTGADSLVGGAGIDFADYGDSTAAVKVSLGSPGGNTGEAVGDKYVAIEGVRGSNFNDTIAGSNAANSLSGNAGNDKLTGAGGADKFIFNTTLNATTNKDTILDFKSSEADKIWLDDDIFTKFAQGTTVRNLSAANFKAGTAAGDANDYIIYNKATGVLSYDADGKGGAAAIAFAIVGTTTHPTLTAADFQIIA